MRRALTVLGLLLEPLAAAVGTAAEAPTLWTSAEVKWTEVAESAGALQALLWGDPKTGDHGTLNRWKFNSKMPAATPARDLHIVILAGTFTLDLEGAEQKQFGPGAFIRIPSGVTYTAGCEAAGECIFAMHQAGPAGPPPPASPSAASSATPAPSPARAPALNAPPRLPASDADNFKKTPPRIDVLLQARYDYFGDETRNSTFFIRKAEVGFKGHISRNVDFCLEIDLARVQANDPYRRTYIRFIPINRLHLKAGLEKAPLGLEELISNAQQPFVDRSEVSDRFSAAEEVGVFGESTWNHWMFQASLTNGGRRLYRDDNRKKAFTARAVWAPTSRFSLGAATMQGETGPMLLDRIRYNVEAKYGANNIQGAQGEFYRAKDGDIWSSAFYLQAFWARPVKGGLLTHVMPVARYEFIDRSDDTVVNELRQVTLGVGLLFNENKAKLQLNWLKDVRTDSPRKHELRAQYVVEF